MQQTPCNDVAVAFTAAQVRLRLGSSPVHSNKPLSITCSYRLHGVLLVMVLPLLPRCYTVHISVVPRLRRAYHPLLASCIRVAMETAAVTGPGLGVRDERAGVNGQVSHTQLRRKAEEERALLTPLSVCAQRHAVIVLRHLTSNQPSCWLCLRVLLCAATGPACM